MSANLASLEREHEENINKACIFFHVGTQHDAGDLKDFLWYGIFTLMSIFF